ncbi:tetratricopeptide repeat protein [Leptothermofonsia sichuanensis E412]|uniref:tetratricopeptide repeat protein n=1 Tax=Leptothermofonsia sichuanensis TaxID=2917832 RepID=UPI001CA7419D|nr:tetratricopeptide repeat protein [Leptothermofonsia sichuanensis]QZZ18947.1 tetratricopeptide repeat protein [Leptothermofonsia sichuanensis E412]
MVSISEAFANAFQAYQVGNLFEAEWTCQQIVEQQPGYVPALHLLGAIAYQTGRLDTAIARYQQLLSVEPDHWEAQGNLAVALQDRGQWEESAHHFQRALALNPNHASAHYNFANLLRKQQDWEAAIAHYRQAIALNPSHARAHNNLGQALRQQGQLAAAEEQFRQALALEPENPELHNNLGNVLQEQGRVEAAIAQYQQSLMVKGDNPEVYFNLGNAMSALGQIEGAITYYASALQLGLERAEVHNNLGLMLQERRQLERAVDHFQRAVALNPDAPSLLTNLGIALYEQNDLEGAIAQYRRAIALDPDYIDAHLNLSFALLVEGNFPEGFAEYEWRFRVPEFQVPELPGDRWEGADLQGKTLLLYAEQGFGDAIQFIRYVPILAQRGASIIVACAPELHRLFAPIPGITQLIPKTGPFPPADFHLPLMSLPLILQSTLETLLHETPYLSPLTSLPSLLSPLPPACKIGITWAGAPSSNPHQFRSYRNKSASLPLFMALQSIPQVALYSLQVGSHASDVTQSGFEGVVQDLSPQLKDFADTAAAIAGMDLVISVDTAVAHLAGALGKPAWLLLPFACDWRWMRHREDSPWYPTMRLFRQDSPGDWAGVMAKVIAALKQDRDGKGEGI